MITVIVVEDYTIANTPESEMINGYLHAVLDFHKTLDISFWTFASTPVTMATIKGELDTIKRTQ